MLENKNATLSVVIPTYNNLNLFKNALSSVLEQTLLPAEIIVTDDSTSIEIEKYVSEINNYLIRYYHNIPSLGAVNNWNYGLSKASGDWVIVLHHDEELGDQEYISRLQNYTQDNDLIMSDIRVRTPSGLRRGRVNGLLKRILLKLPYSLLCVNSIGPCACVAVRKNIIERFDPSLTWMVDTEWYYRLMKASYRTVFCPDLIIISNHGHSDQITSNIDISKKNKEDKQYLKNKYRHVPSVKIALMISSVLGIIRKLRVHFLAWVSVQAQAKG